MPKKESPPVQTCYHRGCGKEFHPNAHEDGECVYHPGVPVFHDAYKGWSCCNKKCTDFTEFLNIKGCTTGLHTGEPESKEPQQGADKPVAKKVVETKPAKAPSLPRPPFEAPLILMCPTVSPLLMQQIQGLVPKEQPDTTGVSVGQGCYNRGCALEYRGDESDSEVCAYHPGAPIFHEGLKYWSCCPKKKTTEFSEFLGQPGCATGTHQWTVKNSEKQANCRLDWHQTPSSVVVSIFAKKYTPIDSTIKLNPIRLTMDLSFLEEELRYELDIELGGVVDVERSTVLMLPSKVEITLKKAEPGVWPQLRISPQPRDGETASRDTDKNAEITERVEAVDLSDL